MLQYDTESASSRSQSSFSSTRVFNILGTTNIWEEFPYPLSGEAPEGDLATPHGSSLMVYAKQRKK